MMHELYICMSNANHSLINLIKNVYEVLILINIMVVSKKRATRTCIQYLDAKK